MNLTYLRNVSNSINSKFSKMGHEFPFKINKAVVKVGIRL